MYCCIYMYYTCVCGLNSLIVPNNKSRLDNCVKKLIVNFKFIARLEVFPLHIGSPHHYQLERLFAEGGLQD